MVKGEERYLYKCSCEQLRKKPLILQILTIIKESEKKRITKNEIIEVGKRKYRDWPKDRDTIFRALKTMSKCKLVSEKRRLPGQATLWSLNKKQISDRELMIHEIKQLEHAVSQFPQGAFESEYFKVELDKIWQKIRTALIDLENQDIACNWMLFRIKEGELFTAKKISLLDKQLSIIFIFCLLKPKWKLLSMWFDVTKIPYRVKANLTLTDIFIRNFYPYKKKEQIFETLGKHELSSHISKKLQFLMMLYYETLQLDYEYGFTLFDKNKFPFLVDNELEHFKEAISEEKLKLYVERLDRKNLILDSMKKPDYPVDEIDLFIEYYKELFPSVE